MDHVKIALDREFVREFAENWPLLLIAFVSFVFSLQLTSYILPFTYPPVIKEFGWTREQATFISSIKFAVGAFSTVICGYLADRIGAWTVIIANTVLSALSLVAFYWLHGIGLYYAIGFVQGMTVPSGYVAMMVLLSRAYSRSLGSATGIALVGSTVCSIIAPLAVTLAIEELGWREGIPAMSVGMWVIVLPLLLYGAFSRNPALMRTHRLGREAKAGSKSDSNISMATVGKLLSDRSFWAIAVPVFLAAVVDQGFRQHQVLIFKDLGLEAHTIALIISSIGAAGIVARLIAGMLLDSRSNKGLSLLFLAEAFASSLAVLLIFPAVLPFFILFRALSQAAISLDASVMSKHIFGLTNLGLVIGLLSAAGSLGSALGPWLMSVVFDHFQTYRPAFVLFTAMPILAAFLTWRIVPKFWLAQKASSA